MDNVAVQLSDALAGAVESVGASVVRVEAGRGLPSSGVAWTADLLVTVHHAIEREDGISIGLPDGSTAEATLVGRDAPSDLALLQIQGARLAPARFDEGAALKVGHLLLGVARPGRTARAALGIAAALGPDWRTPAGAKIDRYLQLDIGRYPGFSGGAVADASGAVVGLSTTGLVRGHILAVPTSTLRRVAGALQAHGHVRRGFLGVGVYPVRLPPELAQRAGQPGGALIISVQAGGAAEKAGVLLGDVLVALDGKPVTEPGDLIGLLDEDRIGARAVARLVRGGQLQDVPLTIGTRGEA